MLRDALKTALETTVAALVREGRLPAAVADVPVEISDTKSPEHGDYACNLAMVAAKRAGMNPRALGELLRDALISREPGAGSGDSTIHDVDVAGPGFLNLRLRPEAIAAWVPRVLAADSFGHLDNPNPQRINVEFVSVNPNGPITIGSGRGAAFGSALCNVLAAAGNVVHREYYINDGVNSEQMRLFAESVRALSLGKALPEKGYKGEYVGDVAEQAKRDLAAWRATLAQLWTKEKLGLEDLRRSHEIQRHRLEELTRKLNELGESTGAKDDEYWNTEFSKLDEGEKEARSRLREIDIAQAQFDDMTSPAALEQARDIVDIYGEGVLRLPVQSFQIISQQKMLERQREDLAAFGVQFDTWFSEQSLHDRGIVAERIEGLKATGVADEAPYRTKLKLGKGGVVEETIQEDQPNEDEGEEESSIVNPQSSIQNTLWLRSTKFGDDMDRVLRRRDGRLTYIASDVAYHEDKLSRPEEATKLITILGPDHHGYIGRLTAVMAALLRGPENTPEANALALAQAREKLEVVIYQLVRFLKDGKPAPMRKRDGNIYELRDLIDELGKSLHPDGTEDERRTTGRDVARFFYLMRSHDTTMDFDIDLATQQSDENPVFYAQYAHARICSVLSRAEEMGIVEDAAIHDPRSTIHLTHPRELALVKKILDLPWEVRRVAEDYGVHRLTTYAVELARTYHHFYDACRVIQKDQIELTWARLALCRATKVALHATFDLLGVSSPERLERRAETILEEGSV